MSRGRRLTRSKPFDVDGYKFATESEAGRYSGLKAYVREDLRVNLSADGRMLVCEWGGSGASPKQAQAFVLAGKAKNKYNAQAVEANGVKFGSGLEARRFADLVLHQAAGFICNLKPHPRVYEFIVNDVRIGSYTPDSEYDIVATGEHVVEDVKSSATSHARDWPLRKKLMLALFGIVVKEFRVTPRPGKRNPESKVA